MKNVISGLLVTAAFGLIGTAAIAADSTFQNTCSNIEFIYQGDDAALSATCLRSNGTPNASVIKIAGIGNQNGQLVQGSGASTFQKSCGSIEIMVSPEGAVQLSALCRTTSGASKRSSLPLQNISNMNGVLTQN